MAITANDPKGTLDSIKKKMEEVEKRIEVALKYAGEMFVKECREQPQGHDLGYYNDRTANLRNSIGYYIFHNGELTHDGSGMVHAAENVQEIARLVDSKGWNLIGIAGMNYASYVEAKGYNVITKQTDSVYVRLETYIKDIQQFASGDKL